LLLDRVSAHLSSLLPKAGQGPTVKGPPGDDLARPQAPGVFSNSWFFGETPIGSAFGPLATNPLQDVWRTIPQFDFPILALAQETDRLDVDEVNVPQVENGK
jgi:hypothetical protein